MDVLVLIMTLALGAAALALWIDVRAPALGPGSVRGALVHLVAALVVCQLSGGLMSAVIDPGNARTMVAAVLGVGLPILVYSFLSGLWIIKLAQDMLGRSGGRTTR